VGYASKYSMVRIFATSTVTSPQTKVANSTRSQSQILVIK